MPSGEPFKKTIVAVELGPMAFYVLEALLLLSQGPNLPSDRTLTSLLTQIAEIWAEGVINPDSAAADLLRQVGHLDHRPLFDQQEGTEHLRPALAYKAHSVSRSTPRTLAKNTA